MKWATRKNCRVDRLACAWLILRFIDPAAVFLFVDDPHDVPADAVAFDMRGVELGHHDGCCSFEIFLHSYDLAQPELWEIAKVVHEADLADDRYDAPEALGLDVVLRGLAISHDDQSLIKVAAQLFDALYDFKRQTILLGREPS